MLHKRLYDNIFTESCRLAENAKKNWASSIKAYLKYLGFRPSIKSNDCTQLTNACVVKTFCMQSVVSCSAKCIYNYVQDHIFQLSRM